MADTASAKLLKEKAKELRITAAERSTAASRLRNEAADQERQCTEMTNRADEYDAAAAKLNA